MAVAITQLADPIGSPNTKILTDIAVTATVVANATGAAATVYHIEFDNTMNSTVTYLKIYESASPTMGGTAATDEPSIVIAAAASTKEYMALANTTLSIATGLSYIATTTQAEHANPTAPTSPCALAIMYKDT